MPTGAISRFPSFSPLTHYRVDSERYDHVASTISVDDVSSRKKRKLNRSSARSTSAPVRPTSTSSPAKERNLKVEVATATAIAEVGDENAAVEEEDAEELEKEDGC